MIKIGVLTFHNACNFGAVWQAYSLIRTLNDFDGVEAEIVNYQCKAIEDGYKWSHVAFRKTSNVKRLAKNLIKATLRTKDILKRNQLFATERKSLLGCSGRAISKAELKFLNEKYDAMIVGSDQIWNYNLTKGDTAFYLDFLTDNQKKYSYAASMGGEITSENRDNAVKHLSSFRMISVREPSTAQYLQKVLTDKQIMVHIDPVFLTTSQVWKDLAVNRDNTQGKVLFFMMGVTGSIEQLIPLARDLTERNHLELQFLSDQEQWYKYRFMKHVGVVSPREFLGLIRNAEYVITNSFHATAFCILFHIDVYVDISVERNERIIQLLNMVYLQNRGIKKYDSTFVPERVEESRWAYSDSVILQKREEALAYLADIIEMSKSDVL